MAHLLGAEALHLRYPTGVVLDSVTLGVNDGARIGIVGRNGDGKSSLLRLLTGAATPDSGRVTRRSGLRVGLLDQADTLDSGRTLGRRWSASRPTTSGRPTRGFVTWSTAWSPTSPGMPPSRNCRAGSAGGRSWPRC